MNIRALIWDGLAITFGIALLFIAHVFYKEEVGEEWE